MNRQRQNNINKRVLLAKLLAVVTKHCHWQRTYSDHCFVEAQLRQHTNRLFDGLDPQLPLMEGHRWPELVGQFPLNLVDPCLVPLPLEIERNTGIRRPFVTLTTPPLTPPESTISWDMMSSSLTRVKSCCGISESGCLACTAASSSDVMSGEAETAQPSQAQDSIHCPDLGLEGPYDHVYYSELPLEETPYHVQNAELGPGHEQSFGPAQDGDKVWQLQMQFLFRGELIEVWKWLDHRGHILHPSHISLPLQLAMVRQLEDTIFPSTNSQLRDFEAEANHNLALMTKEVAHLELLIDKMSRILYELECKDRDPFVEPISVVLLS